MSHLSKLLLTSLAAGALFGCKVASKASGGHTGKDAGRPAMSSGRDSGSRGGGSTPGQDAATDAAGLAQPSDAANPGSQMPGSMQAMPTDGGSLLMLIKDAQPPAMMSGDSGATQADTFLRMVSVPPSYALSGESFNYTPKLNQGGEATLHLVDGPSGMSFDNGRLTWVPDDSTAGDHTVDMEAALQDAKLSQKFDVHVGIATQLAKDDLAASKMGQVVVDAPLSPIQGAAITVPAGALSQTTTISISALDRAPSFPNVQGVLKPVKFGPSGLGFLKPATVALPYDKAGVTDADKLAAYVYDQDHSRWVSVPVIGVDQDNALLMAKASHFSIYAAGATSIDSTLALARMSAASVCEGDVVGRLQVTSGWDAVDVASINNRSSLIDDTLVPAGATNVQLLLQNSAFVGTLRAVSVLDLFAGDDPDRVALGERVLVTSVYVPGDGTALVRHTDALGNLIGERSYPDFSAAYSSVAARLAGGATHARFGIHADANLALAGRMHLLYAEGDATLEPVALDDLGVSLVDRAAGAPSDPATADDALDVDCDRLLGAYDTVDDSQKPVVTADPDGVGTVMAGDSLLLRASVEHASDTPVTSWDVSDTAASLSVVSTTERSFSASVPGRYLINFSAQTSGMQLGHVFAIDVLERPAVNTPPSCTPTASSGLITLGDTVTLSAALADGESPQGALSVQWGLIDRSGSTPVLIPSAAIASGAGFAAAFTPTAEGSFEIGCVASDGSLSSAISATSVSVLAPNVNIPPENLALSPAAATVVLGDSLKLKASASDRDGDALQFNWSGSTDLGAPTSTATDSSVLFTPSSVGQFTLSVSVTDTHSAPLVASASILVVGAPLSQVDADHDGFPPGNGPGLDCNDNNPGVNPAAKEICGNSTDENCDGVVAVDDCDGDGYTVQQGDCNDGNRYLNPGAVEACDGIDNDCDGNIDNGFAVGAACTVGVGACQSAGVNRCSADGSFVTCFALPKAPAAEVCDGVDNNCNGLIDENGVCNPTCSGGQTYDVERRVCVCPSGQLWDGHLCGQSCPSGQVPVYGSQTCRALMAGDTCANAIDLGAGGIQTGTLDGRGTDLPGCWTSTTSLRIFRITVPSTVTNLFTTATGNITASIFQGTCGSQPIQQCAQPGSGHADKVAPGTYYIALGGEGSYTLTVAEPSGSGGCSVPDGDGDGVTLCAGDCDDANAAIHPGAPEVCDGIDNDCNGMADDFAGSCSTGLPGICATGRPGCGPSGATCAPIVQPGQVGEICGDGYDNNCDGQTDESACSQPLPGQTCSSPLPGGYGGVFSGSFAALEPVLSTCAQPGDGHALIHLDVPTDGLELGASAPPNVQMSLYQNDCNGMPIIPCGKNFWHMPLPRGAYLLELTGQGAYSVAIGLRDPQSGLCLTPDGDGDGFSICNGDCNDTDASVHPGAVEVCDGIDNDCAGGVDDLRGTCATGLPGACAAGQLVCAQGGGTQCNMALTAGQEPEYCADGIDNNCDGRTDETGCVSVAPGELCSLPIDLGTGGYFGGDLTSATDDVSGTCSNGMSMADHVYRLTVPAGAPYIADFQLSGQVIASILNGGCGTGYAASTCFDGKVGSTQPNQSGPNGFEYMFQPGVYYLVLEGTGVYQLGVSLRNSQTGTCLTPDGDADGFAICNGDCNDQDPSVHPGAQETCNGRDDDCNGAIDDVQSNCSTGLPGECQLGKTVCVQSGAQCMPFVTPGQHVEYCGDGIDNDCNGQTDEQGCTQLPPGETCALAIDVGQGGSFAGDLTGASDDLPSFCSGPAQGTGDRIYHLVLNQDAMVMTYLGGQAVTAGIFASLCGDSGSLRGCLGSQSASPTGPSSGVRNDWMSRGDYYIVLDGTGPYTLSLGIADSTGNCLHPDADGDGYTLCNGDCDDSDNSVHPYATEICDQRDNDCDGFIDDPHQTCTTGLPGVCNAGDMQCVSGMPQCKPRVAPGQQPEYCSDGVDNDCNGQTDEAGCTAVAAGEICSLPINVGSGGTFVGDLSHATDDVSYTCDGSMPRPDHVYALHVPMDMTYSARLLLSGAASGSLYRGGCGDPASLQSCFGSSASGGTAPMQDFYLGSGDYAIVVEGNGPYSLGVGLRANSSMQCLTPDGDTDGYSLCDGDCDDRDPARHPGVNEVCDGVDNDCNGMVDDVQGSCSTGLPGACGVGKATCSGGAPQCALNLVPGQLPEYCGDQVDNNCDGLTDEPACTAVQAGEVCWLPIDIGTGGHFTGDLSMHTHDVIGAGCWGNEPDMVYALTVPPGANWQVNAQVQGAGVAVLDGDCNHPMTMNCFGPPPSMGGDTPDGGTADGGVPPDGGTFDGGTSDAGSFDGGTFDGGAPTGDGGMPPPDGGSTAPGNNWSFNQNFGPGKHLFMLQGPGPYTFDVFISDAMNGNCITPDSDGDGVDVCHGDCNDHNASIHPGAAEACDGVDNDCDGMTDNPHGQCNTGQPGTCAQGHQACNGMQLACVPLRGPAPEICGDGIDNDCNNLTDETGCTARESCADAEDVGPGGTFYGNLDNAGNDVSSACSMSGQGDHVYRIQLPPSPSAFGTLSVTGNVEVSLFQGGCGGAPYDCSNMNRSFGWGSGSMFYVVVKGSGSYALSLAVEDGGPGQCSVPDLDGDNHTICDRDCDEGNPAVWSGAPEICDGLDNDCDGVIDDLQGSCPTGLPGVCGQGTAACSAGTQTCTPNVPPGSMPDYCGDGIDNDCDGTVDGPGCTQVQPGEVCSLPIDMGTGGTFNGDLSAYTLDVHAGDCGVSHDVVYMLNVPADGRHFASVRANASNGHLAVFSGQGSCGVGMSSCFIPGSQVSLGSAGGVYYFVVSGNGTYTISAAITDLMDNSCSVADHDSDGFTLCDGDCNDADQSTHPGALELCDGIDNDCNGPIDDLKGNCPTGLPGACGLGTPYCSAGTQQCNVNLTPGQEPDYCGDGLDNDCDGTSDGPGCVAVAPGEVCSLAIDLGHGGTFQGDLTSNTDDVMGTCGGQGMADVVYKLIVPPGSGYEARFQLDSSSAEATLFNGLCDNVFINTCFGPGGFQYRQLVPGNYELVVKGGTAYRLSVGVRDGMSGTCLTPDGDGDGITICDNDCDDQNPSIYPGRAEICDGKDNDCDGVIDNGCPPP